MRKLVVIFSMVFLLSYLCIGCQSTNNARILKENDSTLTIQPSNSIKENRSIVENSNTQTKPIEEYYKLSKNDDESYTIILYDNEKNIIHQETVEKEPYINFIDEKVIRVTHSVGSTLNYTYFYDVVKGEISQVYENALSIEKDLIVYMNDNVLIISNIFDKCLYYKEIERDYSQTAVPSSAILSVKFVEPNKIQLDYLEGKDLKEKSETIDLNALCKEDLNSTLNSENNISELQKNGLEIIEDQSFWVEFEKWGKVKFISSQIPDDGSFNLQFYLIDDKGSILYTFPAFYGSQNWFFYELCAISFRDVNKDGLKDVIVIADYVSGAGEGGAIPFPVASVYFQKNKSFVSLTELDSEINDANKNESIDMVIKYLEGKNIKLDK